MSANSSAENKTAVEKEVNKILQNHTLTYDEEYEMNEMGDDVLYYRQGVDEQNRVRHEEYYDIEYEELESSIVHYYDDQDEFEKTVHFNFDGDATKFSYSRKAQFKRAWDDVISIPIYSMRHVQKLSIAIRQNLGEEGKDWDAYNEAGMTDAQAILDHNEEQDDVNEMVKQEIIIGWKNNGKNDSKTFSSMVKRLNLKYMIGNGKN